MLEQLFLRWCQPWLDCLELQTTAETLRAWLRQVEQDSGDRDGISSEERQRIKALEREIRELRQANEILRKASAYFASLSANERISLSAKGTEFDRPFKL